MIDALKQAIERVEQQSSEGQAILAAIIMQALDDEMAWAERLTVPLTSAALDLLAAEAIAEDDAGRAEDVTGDEFLTT